MTLSKEILEMIEDPKSIKDEELWNLDRTIAQFVLPRLIAFKKKYGNNAPNPFFPNFDKKHENWEKEVEKGIKEWNIVLDKMICAMESCVAESYMVDYGNNHDVEEGFQLFGKYFQALWD